MSDRPPTLPTHVEDTVSAIAELHAAHYRRAGWLQQAVTAATAVLARPAFSVVVTVLAGGWVLLNLWLGATGRGAPDPPPFNYLFGVVSLAALYMTALVLATQRHDDELARHREQLTLELAILSEQKSAKIIELLERQRHDDPALGNHRDHEAEAMTRPADPGAVLERIRAAHAAPDSGG